MKKISLSQGKVTVVDDEDYERLCAHKWYYSGGYAVRTIRTVTPTKTGGNRTLIRMHREILGLSGGEDVDHIDHNGLNNCKTNLRVCLRAQNLRNKPKRNKPTSSRYKGVSLCSEEWRKEQWVSYISVDGRRIHLGRYTTEEQAAIAYNEAAIKYHGEFACLNNIWTE